MSSSAVMPEAKNRAGRSLPAAADARLHVALLGDSYIEQASHGRRLVSPSLNAANVSLVNMLAGQPWLMDPEADNFGSGGGRVETMLAAMPALLAREPDIVFMQGGHNDFITHGAGCLEAVIAVGRDQLL